MRAPHSDKAIAPPLARTVVGNRIWEPLGGYELAASAYDRWHWQRFWARNEWPELRQAIADLGPIQSGIDIGCGTGTYLAQLERSIRMVGVDPSAAMLDVAAKKVRRSELLLGSTSRLPVTSRQFGFALSARSLCHEKDLIAGMHEVGRVMAVGGTWLISEVHAEHPYPYTRIPLGPSSEIHIETHKRAPRDIANVASESRLWNVVSIKEFSWRDLRWAPTDPLFARIDQTSARPIFFVLALRRVGAPG